MTPKKVTLPAFTRMEARVEALEIEISEVRSTLIEVHNSLMTNHTHLITMLEKCFGKPLTDVEGSASVSGKGTSVVTEKGVPQSTIGNNLHGDALMEFR